MHDRNKLGTGFPEEATKPTSTTKPEKDPTAIKLGWKCSDCNGAVIEAGVCNVCGSLNVGEATS